MAIQLNNLIAEALKVRKQAQSNATTLNALNKPIPSTTGFKDSYRRNGQFSDSARYQFGSNYFLLPLVLDIYQVTRKTFLTDQFEVLHRVYETHRADITKLEGLNNQKTRQEQAIARDNERRQSEQADASLQAGLTTIQHEIEAIQLRIKTYTEQKAAFDKEWNWANDQALRLYQEAEAYSTQKPNSNRLTVPIVLASLGAVCGAWGAMNIFLPSLGAGFIATLAAAVPALIGVLLFLFLLFAGSQDKPKDPFTDAIETHSALIAIVVLEILSVYVWNAVFTGVLGGMPIMGLVLVGIAATLLIAALATAIPKLVNESQERKKFTEKFESNLTDLIEQENPAAAGEQEAVNNNIVNATTGITSSPDGFFAGSSQQVANLASLDLSSAGNDQPSHPVLKQA